MNIAVIGAGPMGLMCALRLLQKGHKVQVLEQDDRIGGMSASFDFGGINIERYYHFICKEDNYLLKTLEEFGLQDKLRWKETKMGFFHQGKMYKWGDPTALLKFSPAPLLTRIRYALHVLYCKNTNNWNGLDRIKATEWLKIWLGEKGYNIFWKPLLGLKYYQYAEKISAAWIAARIQRIAKSRKSIFKEELGYIEGGSELLLQTLKDKIEKMGGVISLSSRVEKIDIENEKVKSVLVDGQTRNFDKVISTIALPLLTKIIPQLPADELDKINKITNISVVCVLLKLKKRYSENFWTNINDDEIEIPGLVEYSNLQDLKEHIVYVPYYLPQDHIKFKYSDEDFINEVIKFLEKMNINFQKGWMSDIKVNRCKYAQTVCDTMFFEKLPPIRSKVSGLLMADTSNYYPEDRSISESMKLGDRLAQLTAEI